jgi:general secretion pathway protein D
MLRLALLLFVALGWGASLPAEETPPAAAPAPAKPREKQLITMDFQDVEIGVLVKFISEITGRNFILDEKVRGKVTVISPTKITIDEAYRVFQSILEVKGFTTVPAGPVTKIVPIRQAKEAGAPREGVGDQYITQLVPLSFVDASSLVPVLQPMVSKDGLISAFDPTNTLILIDTASNIDRLLGVISELDIEVPSRGIEFIKLENAYADDVAKTLQDVLEASAETAAAPAAGQPQRAPQPQRREGGAPGRKEPFRVIPDARTNSLIVIAGPPQMRTIKNLVRELDRKLEGVSKINVHRLKYANAAEMVEVLSQLIGGGAGAPGGLGTLGTTGRTPSARRTTRQSLSQQRSLRGQLGRSALGQQLGAALGQAGGAAPTGTTAPGAVSAAGGGGEFVGEVRITADPYTNSLIVSAAPQDYDVLRRVIEEIDIPRRQVLVEAIILEVSLDKSRKMGFELQGGIPLTDGVGIGRLNLENLNNLSSNPASLQGLVLAAASNQTVSIPDGRGGRIEVPAQVALFTALQSDTDVNILSAPTILTSDNQEAEILVGQNIPFIASRATDTTNLANTFATVERQDVGITLRLTPQISEGDVVRLDIYEEVSAVVPNPPVDPNLAGPTTTVRSASTTVVARNGQTVVLGGLISDNTAASESKIPFVGDIPVLGHLFKRETNARNKINLLIFLTPRIVYNEADLTRVSHERRDHFEESIAGHAGPSRRRLLHAPSWTPPPPAPILTPPAAPEAPPPTPLAEAPLPPAVAPEAPRLARPAPPAPPAPALPSAPAPPPSALGIPETGHRFAVLLALFEKGEPPPELRTSNGFLTIYFPEAYSTFFEKGGTYSYVTPRFEGKYTCLEVFPDAREALGVYPEGQPLERWQGAIVRWKPFPAEQMQRIVAGLSPWKRLR